MLVFYSQVSYLFLNLTALEDVQLEAKPLVLLLGQYSVGKTTFIQHLIGREFPGMYVAYSYVSSTYNLYLLGVLALNRLQTSLLR